jgi:YbbR domain-containing protein
MKHKITKNWGLKLVSFLFAAVLWLIVTNINDPSSPYKESNIPVVLKNTDLITNNGQIYEVLDGTDMIDSVVIWAPRSVVDKLNRSDIVAEADVRDLTSLNTISIKLSTNKYNDKLDSIKGSIENVKLNIENKETRSFPIKANLTGEVGEGYMVGNVSTEQNLIRVSGPESLISQIARAQAEVDISGFTSNIGTDSDIRLYNEAGVEIKAQSIEKSITKVRVNIEILEKKTVPISFKFSGIPAEGYRATGEITSSRNSVELAGKSETLRGISAIEIPEGVIDVSGAVETVETVIDLRDYLPAGVVLAEEGFDGNISVSVQIEQQRRQTVSGMMENIQFVGVPEGYEAVINEPEERYRVTLIGLASELAEIDVNTLEVYVDVAAWIEAQENPEPESGYFRMPLAVRLPERSQVILEDVDVNVHLREAE